MSRDVVKAVEEKYPETAQEFKANLDRMYETFCSKMWDYGSHNIALGRDLSNIYNKKRSLNGIWFRSNDKMSRIENLLERSDVAVNEPLTDSYLDLANYSVIAMVVDADKWGK
jgi:hypothetical protein